MRSLAIALTLLLLGGLAGQSLAAECYEGTWEVETKEAHKKLEITADGCLKLTVTPKDKQSEAVVYDTCYKIKDKQQQTYRFEIDDHGKTSTAEIVCSGSQVQLKWGEVSSQSYRPVKQP